MARRRTRKKPIRLSTTFKAIYLLSGKYKLKKMEAVGSELNLFKPSLMPSAILGESVQEFQPVAIITQGAPIEFQIKGGGRNYIDLKNM